MAFGDLKTTCKQGIRYYEDGQNNETLHENRICSA